MLLLLPSLVVPENIRSSPLTGAVPPQFAALPQKLSLAPPVQVRCAAGISETKAKHEINTSAKTQKGEQNANCLGWDWIKVFIADRVGFNYAMSTLDSA